MDGLIFNNIISKYGKDSDVFTYSVTSTNEGSISNILSLNYSLRWVSGSKNDYFQIDFINHRVSMQGYAFKLLDYEPYPVEWNISASNDNNTWHILHSVSSDICGNARITRVDDFIVCHPLTIFYSLNEQSNFYRYFRIQHFWRK